MAGLEGPSAGSDPFGAEGSDRVSLSWHWDPGDLIFFA